MSDATLEVVREAYELLRRGDPRRLLELVAPEATWQPATGARVKRCEGGDELAKTLMWRAAVHRLRAGELVDVGDQVVVRVAGRRMARLGAPRWARRIFQVVRVRNGQIVRIDDYGSREEAFAAVGLEA